jgi:hypothetical protein
MELVRDLVLYIETLQSEDKTQKTHQNIRMFLVLSANLVLEKHEAVITFYNCQNFKTFFRCHLQLSVSVRTCGTLDSFTSQALISLGGLILYIRIKV